MNLTPDEIDRAVRRALLEDAPRGDLTTSHVIPLNATLAAHLVAREPGIFAGGDVFVSAFRQAGDFVRGTDSDSSDNVHVEKLKADGEHFDAGDVLARVGGPARAILTGERVALNFVQRMSGIATLTADYVETIAGTSAQIVDTRKTAPGLRAFEKHAVSMGGGMNHRHSLSDAVLIKDNHLAVLEASGRSLPHALRELRSRLSHTVTVEVEIDRTELLQPVLDSGVVDTIMFDNFNVDDLAHGIRTVDGRVRTEASGGVTLDTVLEIARTGVDLISVGALTHSARALDFGLDAIP